MKIREARCNCGRMASTRYCTDCGSRLSVKHVAAAGLMVLAFAGSAVPASAHSPRLKAKGTLHLKTK